MKKIIFKKISLDIVFFFILTIFSLSSIIWVLQAVNFLDIVVEDGHGLRVYLYFTFLNLPKIISKIFPFALFFSFFYILLEYEKNNELLIFWSFGISKKEFASFFIKLSFVFFIIQFILTAFIVPKSQSIARSYIKGSNVDLFEGIIKEKKFIDTFKSLTIYVDKKTKQGELENVFLKNNLSNQITFAKRGVFENRKNNKILVLYDGQTITTNDKQTSNIEFKKTDFNISNFTSKTTSVLKIQENSTKKLISCLVTINKIKSNIGAFFGFNNCRIDGKKNIIEELYKRLLLPIYFPIFILSTLMLVLRSKEEEKFNSYKIIIFLIGVMLIIFSEISVKFLKINLYENIIFLLLPLFIFFILRFTFNHMLKSKK